MKRIFTLLCPAMVILAVACGPTHVVVQTESPAPPPPPPPVQAPPPAITYQTFYDALAPYGQWVDYPGTGYVWVPNVGPDFKPYSSAGHWVYSDQGWTWVSDYPWGWGPFHYGRWFFDDNYGWCWVPGYEWAPAWVSWRTSSNYYGWAPLGPTVGVSVSIVAYNPPPHVWSFVPQQYVTSPHVNNYYVAENQNVTIINRTTVINNYVTTNNRVTNNVTVNNVTNNNVTNNNTTNNINNTNITNNRNVFVGGPPRTEVEAVTHTTIRPVTFRESSTPGAAGESNGQLTIYRPPVKTPPPTGATQSAPAPARIVPFKGTPSPEAGGTNRGNQNPAANQPPRGTQEPGFPVNKPPVSTPSTTTTKPTTPPAPTNTQPTMIKPTTPPASTTKTYQPVTTPAATTKTSQPATTTTPPKGGAQGTFPPAKQTTTPGTGKPGNPADKNKNRRPPTDTTGRRRPNVN